MISLVHPLGEGLYHQGSFAIRGGKKLLPLALVFVGEGAGGEGTLLNLNCA